MNTWNHPSISLLYIGPVSYLSSVLSMTEEEMVAAVAIARHDQQRNLVDY